MSLKKNYALIFMNFVNYIEDISSRNDYRCCRWNLVHLTLWVEKYRGKGFKVIRAKRIRMIFIQIHLFYKDIVQWLIYIKNLYPNFIQYKICKVVIEEALTFIDIRNIHRNRLLSLKYCSELPTWIMNQYGEGGVWFCLDIKYIRDIQVMTSIDG